MRRTAAWLAVAPVAGLAAGPMVTDDARVLDPNACQLETWVRRSADAAQAWALPACNPAGNLELTFGGARTRTDAQSRFTDQLVQAKTVLRPIAQQQWGAALALGTTRHPARESANGWPGDPYFYAVVSAPVLADEAWFAHFNAGAVLARDTGRTIGTWGVGQEVRLREGLYLLPEIYRSEAGRPFFQAGLRQSMLAQRVQWTVTVGNRVHGGAGERWFAVGVRLLSPPFVP
jgi:hypothetical protein